MDARYDFSQLISDVARHCISSKWVSSSERRAIREFERMGVAECQIVFEQYLDEYLQQRVSGLNQVAQQLKNKYWGVSAPGDLGYVQSYNYHFSKNTSDQAAKSFYVALIGKVNVIRNFNTALAALAEFNELRKQTSDGDLLGCVDRIILFLKNKLQPIEEIRKNAETIWKKEIEVLARKQLELQYLDLMLPGHSPEYIDSEDIDENIHLRIEEKQLLASLASGVSVSLPEEKQINSISSDSPVEISLSQQSAWRSWEQENEAEEPPRQLSISTSRLMRKLEISIPADDLSSPIHVLPDSKARIVPQITLPSAETSLEIDAKISVSPDQTKVLRPV